jgi:hypothetical protein
VLPPRAYRDDAMLTTAANNALAMNITVPDGVEATARDGDLTLTGTVSYGSQRDAAERAVAGLAGVRNVRDDIEIAYDADPVDVDLHVQEALDRSALVPEDSERNPCHVQVSATAGPVFGHLLLALIALAAGVVAIVWPGPTALVLFARPGVGAVTLALLFGLFTIVYGISQITLGIETRRTGKTLHAVLPNAA